MQIKHFFYLWLSFALLASCKTETKNNTLQFNVDPVLLGDQFSIDSLQFGFSVPAGWEKMSDSVMTRVNQKISVDSSADKLDMHLLAFYLDSLSSSFCSVSGVRFDASTVGVKDLYRESLQKKYPGSGIKEGDFVINDVTVHQFLIMTDQKVVFKLLLNVQGDSFLQIDYAIDRVIYPKYVNKIESSIGSITSTI
ncbi:MAG: hypothetical protein H6627_05135 [Calditrichae bacterium]|nr:hypothetical protein [Calditrichota bacterium]MCB9057928.1 hypothetical protein [Calditrichia bacterium]